MGLRFRLCIGEREIGECMQSHHIHTQFEQNTVTIVYYTVYGEKILQSYLHVLAYCMKISPALCFTKTVKVTAISSTHRKIKCPLMEITEKVSSWRKKTHSTVHKYLTYKINTFFFRDLFYDRSSSSANLLLFTGGPQCLLRRGRVQHFILWSGPGCRSKYAHGGRGFLVILSFLWRRGVCATGSTRILTLAHLFVMFLDSLQDIQGNGLGCLTGLTSSTSSRPTTGMYM